MILVIGLDGYDADWAPALWEAGFSTAPLHAPIPLTWVAWNTIGTGVDAPAWGVSHEPQDYIQFARSKNSRPPYLWEHSSEARMRSVIVNWPFVLTAKPTRGVLVCGYPALREWYVRPANQAGRWDYEELDTANRWGIGRNEDAEAQTARRFEIQGTPAVEHLASCQAAAESLTGRFADEVLRLKPRLAFLGLHDLDRLSHYTFGAMHERAFLDKILGYLVGCVRLLEESLQPEATIIFSDHGLELDPEKQGPDRQNMTHGIEVPGSHLGILALKQQGWHLAPERAQQIDVLPMVLNRLGIGHGLSGVDRSVRMEVTG